MLFAGAGGAAPRLAPGFLAIRKGCAAAGFAAGERAVAAFAAGDRAGFAAGDRAGLAAGASAAARLAADERATGPPGVGDRAGFEAVVFLAAALAGGAEAPRATRVADGFWITAEGPPFGEVARSVRR